MRSRCDNYTSDQLVPGIPSIAQAWGLWALLGAAMLLLLISLAVHLFRWTSGRSQSHPGQRRPGGSVEEVPLYGNLHYLQTGRLSQEPGPDQQDPTPRGPSTAAEEVMCYTSLQLRPSQGRIPSPGTPIKYSEVVLDSEPKPQASGPEPELYASVCAQTRRARASFPDQAYANSQPAPS
ncbi:signaling threshold-regulating transmembrane adapter 1 [Leopardus geoffroyi]|uniref:Signaling threshold-regulating transmembrane adapter 1 isoform X1 n=2 Tax=Acinonyx jubatus TaxID=32536 RepID=A0A6I9ZZC6_ACIJB|nr:signaling threshold-regulating transmembrane adapter 1 isoform X1 [Acinonyx jubatus]XP_026895189.2 signaling threshold-regulating transmembrane adapter 1 isoform X1 [Acinonyx jubatus]XP_045325592.1 signaling threshold-regulating transmembrane adapter 1 [Leopardus geoffroyi]XP_045325593.1 signaling threshold-regulating transmembrane adapter 1 [Leopardus geoffroyi]XP_045325594.1 signaling threshold-regulating transmembrane adapter 1 [Leopardus geoffroyi]